MVESQRGCGYRKIGGLYLVSEPGLTVICDGLPIPLDPCGCCGFKPPFSRNLQKLNPQYILQAEVRIHEELKHKCKCGTPCCICDPDIESVYGLMFVGAQSYTPSSFIKEAVQMGVSKRIPEIPSWLKLGETWVLLAHQKVPDVDLDQLKSNGLMEKEPKTAPRIFYAFKPTRVEMPVWKGELSDAELLKLEEKGITPVLIEKTPENLKKHKQATGTKKRLDRFFKEEKEND